MSHSEPVADRDARPARRITAHVAVLVLLGAAIAGPAIASTGPPTEAAPRAIPARYALPLPGAPHVQRAFEQPPAPWAAGHRGVDLAAVPGGDVLAPGAGVVTFAGRVAGRPVVTIAHAGGQRSSVEPVAPDVAAGDRVQVGEVIGALAPSGWHCESACLHWGIRVGTGAAMRYIDPMALVARAAPIILLPDEVRRATP
jgi:murein DD-endopeptidase MepM/ murein hydrolase activator NlpD